ncbi:putative HTH-type transcriptional regulator [Agromyces rhizosphaerae]|uniref:HTH-type transcriptional regulator n=1 Tax=Agromyces rhizosphaerae TaxID=88374 RepID=A0A9W6FR17_9MICO|nr:MerR family transcriptional regulator [Agromyces rhizosphaerae]GLI29100.1 putative HTH-type transcriptional regulator [Agromyces rhizosphaerae]
MPRSAASTRTDGDALLGIGQVLSRLTPEFPELTPSKLRFLEEQGLITPARSESGYRKFCEEDVDRITLILSMQRDHYLPLKVIRTYLEDQDAGREPQLPVPESLPTMLDRSRRLGRDELVREAEATHALLDEAVAASLLPAATTYGEDALVVLRSLAELRSVGIEPRHLRGLRSAAERETVLIQNAVEPIHRRGAASSRAGAAERALEIAGHLESVRSSLIRSAIVRQYR